MSCGIGHRCSLDPEWLWHRLAVVALIQPLAWECPYAAGAALKGKKKKTKKTNKQTKKKPTKDKKNLNAADV